jgi:PAS domain S-box-containing protein
MMQGPGPEFRKYPLAAMLFAFIIFSGTIIFLHVPIMAQTDDLEAQQLLFSEAERAWLREHPVVRVAQDPAWPPMEYADRRGRFMGMSSDYLDRLEKKIGITFDRITGLSWQQAYAGLKSWEIDMTTSVTPTPERLEFWAFTRPYIDIPIVIAAGLDVPYIAHMAELSGKKVSVVDGYAVSEWIPRDFPDIDLVRVPATRDGLELLARGEVVAHVDNMLVIGYYLAELRVADIKVAGKTPYVNAQCMAVRKDWAIFAGILQKALDSLTSQEHAEIYKKWVPVRFEHPVDYSLVIKFSAVFIAVLTGMGLWIARLFLEIKKRKQAEHDLAKSRLFYSDLIEYSGALIFVKDRQGRYEMVNRKWEETTGHSREHTIGKTDLDLFPGEVAEEFIRTDWMVMESGEVVEKEETLKGREGVRYFLSIKFPLRPEDGRVRGICGMATEITERKRAESSIRELLDSKELLLKEAHHRVKNNMGTVIGLLALQAESLNEARAVAALDDARNRLQGMWLLYDKLYRPDMFKDVPLNVFLPSLVREIMGLFPGGADVRTNFQIDNCILDVRVASSLGIIINELVTNAMKHAFAGRDGGELTLSASLADGRMKIVFADNGGGMPPNFAHNLQASA